MAELGKVTFSEEELQSLVEDIMQTVEHTHKFVSPYTKSVLIEGMISDWLGLNGVEVVYE